MDQRIQAWLFENAGDFHCRLDIILECLPSVLHNNAPNNIRIVFHETKWKGMRNERVFCFLLFRRCACPSMRAPRKSLVKSLFIKGTRVAFHGKLSTATVTATSVIFWREKKRISLFDAAPFLFRSGLIRVDEASRVCLF